jgi:hypothetical protein
VNHKATYVGEIVKPRTLPEFRQLSAKFIPKAEARRNDAGTSREGGYFNGSSVFQPLFGL